MTFALYILAGILILILILLVLPLEFGVWFGREGEDDLLILEIFLWPAFRYRHRVVMIDLGADLKKVVLRYSTGTEKKDRPERRVKEKKIPGQGKIYSQYLFWKDIYRLVRPSIRFFMFRARISELTWKTRFGFDDPFYTGMATGMIWSLKGLLVSFLCSLVSPSKKPVISVVPDFSGPALSMRLDLRVSTRAAYIFHAGLKMLWALLVSGAAVRIYRLARGGEKLRKAGGKPHRFRIL